MKAKTKCSDVLNQRVEVFPESPHMEIRKQKGPRITGVDLASLNGDSVIAAHDADNYLAWVKNISIKEIKDAAASNCPICKGSGFRPIKPVINPENFAEYKVCTCVTT